MIGSPPLPHQAQKQNLELGTLQDYPGFLEEGDFLAQRREAVWMLQTRA